MRKLKLYIETSTWNFFFTEDAPQLREITKNFFALIGKGSYEIYASEVVLKEIAKAPLPRREELMGLIRQSDPSVFELGTVMKLVEHISIDLSSIRDSKIVKLFRDRALTKEAEELAQQYIKQKIVPENKIEDALHIAIATVAEIDAVVTWNYKHLANLRREELFQSVNLGSGYLKKIEIVTPMEVIGDEIR